MPRPRRHEASIRRGRVEEIRARWADPQHLREEQYATPENLDARIALHRRFSTNAHGWPRWFFDQFAAPEEARLLDVGCGPGLVWAENLDRVPESWSVTLVDVSPGMVDAARSRLGGDVRFSYVVADAQDLPFDDGAFDVAMANNMLYHVPDRARAIRELRRVVDDEGLLYVSTVGASHMRELHALVQGWDQSPLKFLVENAPDELRAVFADVQLRPYDDALEVTEPEPLMAVVRSGVAGDLLAADEIDAIRRRIDETIARDGAFRITKSSGTFVCR